MNISIIGYGYWGPNLLRNFCTSTDCNVLKVSDLKEERLAAIKRSYPTVEVTKNYKDLINDKKTDAVVISTPVDTHYMLAKKSLEAGKHIWVEKPFTSDSKQAEELIELAEKKNLKIFVDHTFVYTGAVMKMKELTSKGELGNILYFDSVRINLGLFQRDVNVIWDLAPHDLSIMNYVLDKKPVAINANGIANFYDFENVAHISVYFDDNCFAHFHVNWTSPVKIRRMLIGGDKKMLVFDDLENFEKIKIYDTGVKVTNKDEIYNLLVEYRTGDMYSPKVSQTEALTLGVKECLSAIKENRTPLTSGIEGLKVVKILEAAEKSIKLKGELIYL